MYVFKNLKNGNLNQNLNLTFIKGSNHRIHQFWSKLINERLLHCKNWIVISPQKYRFITVNLHNYADYIEL